MAKPSAINPRIVIEILQANGGNIAYTAQEIGRSRNVVYRLLQRMGIDPKQIRAGIPILLPDATLLRRYIPRTVPRLDVTSAPDSVTNAPNAEETHAPRVSHSSTAPHSPTAPQNHPVTLHEDDGGASLHDTGEMSLEEVEKLGGQQMPRLAPEDVVAIQRTRLKYQARTGKETTNTAMLRRFFRKRWPDEEAELLEDEKERKDEEP